MNSMTWSGLQKDHKIEKGTGGKCIDWGMHTIALCSKTMRSPIKMQQPGDTRNNH